MTGHGEPRRFVLVTGMSGAGLSTTLKSLEDLGYEVLDNLPLFLFDLLLRGYAPRWVRRLFARRLERYEMRDVVDANPARDAIGIPLMSGAFMLVRREAIDRTGGFDPRFFLYFEDFDWSLRLGNVMRNAWVPEVRVVHHGGGAARKGFAHLGWYLASGWRFYRKHGWKWV